MGCGYTNRTASEALQPNPLNSGPRSSLPIGVRLTRMALLILCELMALGPCRASYPPLEMLLPCVSSCVPCWLPF